MDGDLLLTITEQDLSNDLGMTTAITRKRQVGKKTQTTLNLQTRHWRSDDSSAFCPPRFLRDLRVLKTYGNYSTCDPHNMADWLVEVDPRFRQYTYGLVQSGVDRNNVQAVTDQQLQHDCHIDNGVHRAKILSFSHRPVKPSLTDSQPAGPDVFISYRRTTGSQLARSELGLNGASKHILFMFISPTLHFFTPCYTPASLRCTCRFEASASSLMWRSWRRVNLRTS